ncbi:hypothetical protein BaRGS_00033872, partial [Batillaria attramentaria]
MHSSDTEARFVVGCLRKNPELVTPSKKLESSLSVIDFIFEVHLHILRVDCVMYVSPECSGENREGVTQHHTETA